MEHFVRIPAHLHAELTRLAGAHNLSVDEVVRRMLRVGLLAFYVGGRDDAEMVLRDADGERLIDVHSNGR